jgi:hypothetical protein
MLILISAKLMKLSIIHVMPEILLKTLKIQLLTHRKHTSSKIQRPIVNAP